MRTFRLLGLRAALALPLTPWVRLALPLLAALTGAALAGLAARALGLGPGGAVLVGAAVAVAACLWISHRLARDLATATDGLARFLAGQAVPGTLAPRTRAFAGFLHSLGAITSQAGNLGEIRQRWLERVAAAAAQEERNRLARDLHDSIKQQLFSQQLGLATVAERWEKDTPGARAALAAVQQGVRETLSEMQGLLEQLQPQTLATAGLVEALRAQCESLGYRTGAQVTLELLDPEVDSQLLPAAQETLFRIAQEALANVFRHARAEQVRVRLGRRGRELFFEVLDNGRGFDSRTTPRGMGLRNLEERAAALSGHLRIASRPRHGTALSVRVPLLAPAASPVRGKAIPPF